MTQALYNRLAHVLRMSTRPRRCQLHMTARPNVFRLSPIACAVGQQVSLLPYADVTVRSGAVSPRTSSSTSPSASASSRASRSSAST